MKPRYVLNNKKTVKYKISLLVLVLGQPEHMIKVRDSSILLDTISMTHFQLPTRPKLLLVMFKYTALLLVISRFHNSPGHELYVHYDE